MEFEFREQSALSMRADGTEVALSVIMKKPKDVFPKAKYVCGVYVYNDAIMTKKDIAIARAKVIDGILKLIIIFCDEGYEQSLAEGRINETHEHEANKKRKD